MCIKIISCASWLEVLTRQRFWNVLNLQCSALCCLLPRPVLNGPAVGAASCSCALGGQGAIRGDMGERGGHSGMWAQWGGCCFSSLGEANS